jgi:protease secretion system outer membrane protein
MMKPQLIKVLTLFIQLLAIAFTCSNVSVSALTINEAFNKAVEVDPGLRSSRYSLQSNSESVDIARSRLLPQITLQGSSNQLTQTTTQQVPGGGELSRSFTGPSINHQLVIRQGLIRPKEYSALSLAKLQSKYGEIKYLADLSDLWLRVAYAYIDLVGAQQIVDTYEKPLLNMSLAAKQEKARFEKGDGTKDALIEADAQYQLSKAMHIQALNNLMAKQRSFELITGVDSVEIKKNNLSLSPVFTLIDLNREQVWRKVEANSYELQMAELQIAMQKERVRMASADHLPTFDMLLSRNIAKNDATSTQGYQYKNNQIGVQYSLPIYTGGGISATLRQAENSLQATLADRDVISNKIINDFTQLWLNLIGIDARLAAGYKLIASSKEQIKATESAYTHGVKTIMEVATAELALARRIAEQQNLNIEYQKNIKKIFRNDFN